MLAAYDTIIVDEAHERSLNIDFLLGYLKQLLPRRPDLKLIITSATLDAERFARHFGEARRAAPVIEVRAARIRSRFATGRWRRARATPTEADDEEELEEAIVATRRGSVARGPGDILVFLPGEREIRETAELARTWPRAPAVRAIGRGAAAVRATLGRPSSNASSRRAHGRRIVLATNVAETSLTVPGIRYVIDSGLARVKRYSLRNKVTLLQIEKISQAAANQRAGRCGRVAAGVCVRLYARGRFRRAAAHTPSPRSCARRSRR